MMHHLKIADDPLQVRVGVSRIDMVDNSFVAPSDRLPAPCTWQVSRLPVFIHEPHELLPAVGLVKPVTRHQEICPARKSAPENRGAENSLIIVTLLSL
jgi:hypothetical protein